MTDYKRVAKILADIHGKEFGGKPKGRYRISRARLLQFLGTTRLMDEDFDNLHDELLELGFSFLNFDAYFALIESSFSKNWRRMTKKLINEFVKDTEARRIK